MAKSYRFDSDELEERFSNGYYKPSKAQRDRKKKEARNQKQKSIEEDQQSFQLRR
jgi:hypothetical protein